MSLRLLKFDTINPESYLDRKVKDNLSRFNEMSRSEALQWIISTRGNFSDFYTYNLNKLGWEAEEFFVNDHYIGKVAEEFYGGSKRLREFREVIKNKFRPQKSRWRRVVIHDYVKKFKPDVILVRERVGIQSDFWRNFENDSLLISRLAAPVPRLWSPTDWDLILTSTDVYKSFFELNGVNSEINHNGFDARVLDELTGDEKKYDVTFVGGLGSRDWISRTKCAESFADKVDFKWWGYGAEKFSNDHPLKKSWQGLTSGIDMLQIYKQSKIVFNDYGEIADGMGVNQRLFEVLGVGSLLLTRYADNLKHEYPDDIFVTFKDEKDCLEKINYFLINESEREKIARNGQKFILENYNYEKLMKELDVLLKESYRKKFPSRVNSVQKAATTSDILITK